MRLQITVDDDLGTELQNKAHDLGFSVSSYVRYLLKKSLANRQPNMMDAAMDDLKNGRVEKVSLDMFKRQLEELK